MPFEEAVSIAASFVYAVDTSESLLDLLFVGAAVHGYTTGRGQLHTAQMLEILAGVRASAPRAFSQLAGAALGRRSELSSVIVVLLAWDEARRAFVHSLAGSGIEMRVLLVCEERDTPAGAAGVCILHRADRSRPGGSQMSAQTERPEAPPLLRRASFSGAGKRLLPHRARDRAGGSTALDALQPSRQADFNRIADFTTWLFVGIAGYPSQPAGCRAGDHAFEWLPGLVVPIVAVQRFSRAGRINLTALLPCCAVSRRAAHAGARPAGRPLSWIYLAISCAAGASNQRGPGYFAGVLAITGWALWSIRPAHAPRAVWAALFVLGSGAGYAGHVGLSQLQGALESWISDWLIAHSDPDPYNRSTNIGHVGELKHSGAIVARVHARPGEPAPPQLLHRASYNVWFSNTWLARAATLAPVTAESDGKTWVLSGEPVLARTPRSPRASSRDAR